MATLVTPGGEDAPARLPPKKREPDAHLVTVRQKCLARIRADREAKHRSRRTQTPHNRAQALLDDVLGRRKRVRDEDYGGDEFTKKLREAVPSHLDPYEPDFQLTPEDEAALICVEINQCVRCTRQFFRRVDGVEDDAMIQHERAVKF